MSSARNRSDAAEIIFATTTEEVDILRDLFKEYASNLQIDICFQNSDHELATLPGCYGPPGGCLLLARVQQENAGWVALRPMEGGPAEIKRLYVRPEFRRHGIGKMLVQRALMEARSIGCRLVRLDTLREMPPAIALYTGFGFKEDAPYRPGEPEGICYFELALDSD